MTSAWFLGASHGVPQDESDVRDTRDPIRTDPLEAESDATPDFTETETDDSGQLTGLSTRIVAAKVDPSEKSAPDYLRTAQVDTESVVNSQVSSSGTAAARESAGQVGHGTMQFTRGLSPELRDGAAFGDEYFVADDKIIQEGSGEYMEPTATDNFYAAVQQRAAITNSRRAFNDALLAPLIGG
jgi:hypothetical protein